MGSVILKSNNYIIKTAMAAFILIYFMSIPYFSIYASNVDLDPSWQNVYKWLLFKNCNFGIDIIYTFGPLAGYFLSTYNHEYFLCNILVNIGLVLFFICQFVYIAMSVEVSVRGNKYLCSLLAGIFVFLIFWPYSDVLYYSIILCTFIYMRLVSYRCTLVLILQLALLAVLGLVKFSFLLSVILLFFICIFLGIVRRNCTRQVGLLCMYIGFLLIFWHLSGQSIINLPAYMFNYLDMAFSYNGAMGVNGIKGWKIFDFIAISLLGGLTLYFLQALSKEEFDFHVNMDHDEGNVEKLEIKIFILFLLLVLFKYGMGRHDLHQNAFWEFLMLISLLIPSVCYQRHTLFSVKKLSLSIYIISLLCLTSGMLLESQNNYDLLKSRFEAPFSNIKANSAILFKDGLNEYQVNLEKAQLDIYNREASLPTFEKIINNDTVDVYNYRQNYAILNDFNYRPRPVFQGYQTFTKNLMEKNENFILTNPSDYIIFKQETIDNRLGLMDDSMWLAEVLNNYDLVAEERDLLLLKKKESFQEVKRFKVSDGVVDFDDIIDIPCKNGERISISMEIENSVLGKILSMLWKPPIVEMELIKDNGDVVVRRIIPSMIRTPVYIDGVIDNNDDVINLVNGTLKNKITKIKIKKPFMYNWLFNCNIKYTLYAERVNNHWLLDK